MTTIEELYINACKKMTDIHEHLPILRRYAGMSEGIVEFGVRYGESTVALLAGKPKWLLSFDTDQFPLFEQYRDEVAPNTRFEFVRMDDRDAEIPLCDLLFIDTVHTYEQLSSELTKHSKKVRWWIILHDTHTPPYNRVCEPLGMWKAVAELMVGGEWYVLQDYDNNNGLTILARAVHYEDDWKREVQPTFRI